MNIELFKTNVKRNPTILFIIFSVITLGIYIFYWVFSRKNSLNLISEKKLNNAVVIIYFISAIGSYLGGLKSQDSDLIVFSNLLGFVSFISGIVISFKMKDILKEFSDNNEINIGISSPIVLADESISNNNLTLTELLEKAYKIIVNWTHDIHPTS